MNDELVPLVGAIRLQQGRFAEAAPLFERGRALNPHLGRFAFSTAPRWPAWDSSNSAVAAFQAAIKMEPNAADAYLALGMAQRKLGQPEDALATYRKLLRVRPEMWTAISRLASVLAETGQMAEAEAPLRKALVPRARSQAAGRHSQQPVHCAGQPEQACRSAGEPGAHPGAGAGIAQPGQSPHRHPAPAGAVR